uniref:Uncharacterized protein n=1 Tax=Laticauda laticaudata TaxID=8630 RepID=A0A8C5RT53_LATLA
MRTYPQPIQNNSKPHPIKHLIFVFLFRKELITKLDEAEKDNKDAAQLTKEYADLTEENRTLKLTQTQCVEQLEKLRIQYQKRQGSS